MKKDKEKIIKNKTLISVIVIAKNEEEVIGGCLESVEWADEVVILDTGSIDKTTEVAEKYGAKVYKYEGPKEIDYSAWRNFALKKITGNWVLYLDADERATSLLREEILIRVKEQESKRTGEVGFAIPRRNIRLGKEMRFGGWWPDYVLRLIKKDKLVKWEGKLHEQPQIEGRVGKLEESLIHYSHRGSFEHKLSNTIQWSGLEAEMLFKANHPPMNTKRFFGAMGREFYKRMIKLQAWRDGTEGVLEAIYQVFSVFITYARLWEMQNFVKNEKFKAKNL